MIISKELDIKVGEISSNKLKGYFKKLGYDLTQEIITVKIEDMPKSSREYNIEVRCEYCGETYSTSLFNYYRLKKRAKKLDTADKDCCGTPSCKLLKAMDTSKKKYGASNYNIKQTTHVLVNGIPVDATECVGCGIIKALTEFPKDKRHSNGRASRCKDCTKNYMNEPDRKERIRQYQVQYNLEHKRTSRRFHKG